MSDHSLGDIERWSAGNGFSEAGKGGFAPERGAPQRLHPGGSLWLIPKIKDCTRGDYLAFGVLWFVLTNGFDLRMILAEGGGLSELLALYDVTTGNLWLLVVIVTALAPYLAAKWRRKI